MDAVTAARWIVANRGLRAKIATGEAKPADALHLALAASAGADYFVTTDTKLHSLIIPGIIHICSPEAIP